MTRTCTEARISTASNVLLVMPSSAKDADLADSFCGSVMHDVSSLPDVAGKSVYLQGDIDHLDGRLDVFDRASRVFVVESASAATGHYPSTWSGVDEGMVPLLWHGVGVYYRRFFSPATDYFAAIQAEHTFQSLTESSKPQKAHRTGLYLTPVEQKGDELHFRLLRCSTNLSGPTENFGATDTQIVAALNREAGRIFDHHAPLNHVLAQIYPNVVANATQKQTKAKISSHADKTKDMPVDGILAFCTFYDDIDGLRRLDGNPFDYGYKSTSAMTRLDFRLKGSTPPDRQDLPERFAVTLYPGSVFFMPLSTNRLYTHAIRASALDASQLPTRLGYVVRCSATEAVHRDGDTFLKADGGLSKLRPPTPEGIAELRELYAQENETDEYIDYGRRFDFSMNAGDYEAPGST